MARAPKKITFQKALKDLSKEEMHALLDDLATTKIMREEMYVGIRFLHMLLDRDGVESFVKFVERIHGIMDEEERVLESDFTKVDWKMLGKARRRGISRRDFLQTFGWGIPGGIAIGAGLFKTADEVTIGYHKIIGDKDPDPPEVSPRLFRQLYDWIDTYLQGPSELLIGAALMQEFAENWRESKLESATNAVAEMIYQARQQAAAAAKSSSPTPAR